MGRHRSELITKYFKVLSDKKSHICKYCDLVYKHKNATKMKLHLLKCRKCPEAIKKTVRDQQKQMSGAGSGNNHLIDDVIITPKPNLPSTSKKIENFMDTISVTEQVLFYLFLFYNERT